MIPNLTTIDGLHSSRPYQDNPDLISTRLQDLALHHAVVQAAMALHLPLTETLMHLVEAVLEQNEVLRKQLLIVMNELDNIRGKR